MRNFTYAALLASGILMAGPFALADTPPTIASEHGHGVQVTGKLTLFRAQMEGMEIGTGKQMMDAEVLVMLDSQPGKVYGVRLHEPNPASEAMVDTLRAAYLGNIPVTIEYRLQPGKEHLNINWVQYGATPK